MKKFLFQTLGTFAIIFGIATLYLYFPHYYESIDNRLRDNLFIYRGEIPVSENVAIVDHDERSLQAIGQWPWPRDVVAQILVNLTNAGVGVIGMDIVFAEYDNSSPSIVLKKLDLELENVPDYDEILGNVVAQTPTILGYVWEMENSDVQSELTPEIPAIFVENNKPDAEFLIQPIGAVLNNPKLQDKAYSSGFFNMVPDPSGIVRSVPLVMKHEGFLYSSLSLEMIRAALAIDKVEVNYDAQGVSSIQLGEIRIPTDRYGRLAVNFRGGKMSYPYISAVDIYNNDFDPAIVEGKFILWGTSAAGLLDLRSMPFESAYPGVEVHANAIDNIITGDFLSRPSWAEGADLILIALIAFSVMLVLNFSGATASFLFLAIAAFGIAAFNYYLLFSEGIILNILFPLLTLLVSFIIATVISYFFETRQKEMIKAKFAKKVSPAVVEDLMKNPDDTIMEGTEREVTIFFSDVRGFTSISEAMGSAKALIDFLNEYMDPMVDIVVDQKGTVDKFIGDAIMAYWNAPNDVPDHRDRALEASLQQLKALKELNVRLEAENKPRVDIGIGLNTGLSVVGEMGSSGRSDYTVIGDPVNLASRLEGLCKPYGAKLIISEFTFEGLQDKTRYMIRELDLVRVKGKELPVRIYEVLGFAEDRPKTDEEIEQYLQALYAYRQSSFEEARGGFVNLSENAPDKLYPMYQERCEHYIKNPPESFDGVFTFTTK